MEDDDYEDLMCMLAEDYSEDDFQNNMKTTGEIYERNIEIEIRAASYQKFRKRMYNYDLPPIQKTKIFSKLFENELIKEILSVHKFIIKKPLRFSVAQMLRMVDISENKFDQLQIQYLAVTGILKNLENLSQIDKIQYSTEEYTDQVLLYFLLNAKKSIVSAEKLAQESIIKVEQEKQDKEKKESFLSFVYFIAFCAFIYFIISISSKNHTFKQNILVNTYKYNQPKSRVKPERTRNGRYILNDEQIRDIYEDGVFDGEDNINSLRDF